MVILSELSWLYSIYVSIPSPLTQVPLGWGHFLVDCLINEIGCAVRRQGQTKLKAPWLRT